MWLLLAFLSAALLGFYDVFKKKSLKDNAVLPVLFLNTLFSSLIFLPFILGSAYMPEVLGGTIFDVPVVGWEVHLFILLRIVHCTRFVDFWILWHEASATNDCRPYQCHTPHHGAGGSYVAVWRTAQPVSVDWSVIG